MKRISTLFLRFVIVLWGLGIFAFLLWEPQVEGRNKDATQFEIYFQDSFLAYVYLASIPFFVGLYQAFKLLSYAGQNKEFSPAAVKALRTIKFCALAIIGFALVSLAFLPFGDPEDRPQGVVMRLVVIFGAAVVASTVVLFERICQNAVNMKPGTS